MVLRSIKVMIGVLGPVALLVAAPVELSLDPLQLAPNLAAAKPGGNGKGRGHGKGHGPAAGQLDAQGFANGETNAGQANAGPANGRAKGRAVGHASEDAVSGVEHAPPGQAKKAAYDGVAGPLGVNGSFNAIHSAAINKGVVSPNSRVAKVEAYVNAAQDLTDAQTAQGDVNGADVQAAIESAALAAANASSQPVTADMLDKVNGYANERGLTTPGIDVSPENQEDVAERARDIQSGS